MIMMPIQCGYCHELDAVMFIEKQEVLYPRCQKCGDAVIGACVRFQLIYPPEIVAQPTLEERIKAAREHCMKMDWGETGEIWRAIAEVLALARGKEKPNE